MTLYQIISNNGEEDKLLYEKESFDDAVAILKRYVREKNMTPCIIEESQGALCMYWKMEGIKIV